MKILNLLIMLSMFGGVQAQNRDLLEAYLKKDFKYIASVVEQKDIFTSEKERSFYLALFERDGEKAVETYKALFQEEEELYLKYLAAERLQDYFYARGYYATSAEYRQYVTDHERDIELSRFNAPKGEKETNRGRQDDEKYYIQVGAFGIEDNARQMVEMLQTQNYVARIKMRQVSNRRLYCVWVDGTEDFRSTLKLADKLKQKYHLKYKLIKE